MVPIEIQHLLAIRYNDFLKEVVKRCSNIVLTLNSPTAPPPSYETYGVLSIECPYYHASICDCLDFDWDEEEARLLKEITDVH